MEKNAQYPYSVIELGAICDLQCERLIYHEPELGGLSLKDHAPHNLSSRAIRTGQVFTTVKFDDQAEYNDIRSDARMFDFSLEEFADLDDRTRVVLRDDRGWSSSYGMSKGNSRRSVTGREVSTSAILVLEPDDNQVWVAEIVKQLLSLGYNVDPKSVHSAPFRIEFGSRLRQELRNVAP